MSERWPGGIVRSTPVTPTGPLQNGTAPGIWTMEQAAYWTKQGLWPTAGNFLAVEDVFSTWLYTGNSSTQTITNGLNLSGQGGMVWVKQRNSAQSHRLYDTSRGVSQMIASNTTSAQANTAGFGVTSFSSSGFTLVDDASNYGVNFSGNTYASWTFREAANFFDVVTWTGNGSSGRTISHNLGVAPGCVMIKRTDSTGDWTTWHRSLSGSYPSSRDYLFLNSTAATTTAVQPFTVAPSATELTLSASVSANSNGATYVAYLYAHDTSSTGIIQCGSFTTDGSGNATVNLGWEPQWVLYKSTNVAYRWILADNMRGMPATGSYLNGLYPHLSDAEDSGENRVVQPTATGFNVSAFQSTDNIYIAIRRGPMRTPTLGTTVFSPIARTGTGGTATVTTNFVADTVISKTRGTANPPAWFDRLRGNLLSLWSSSTAAEYSSAGSLTGFDNNTGYVVGADVGDGLINYNTYTYANYAFRRAPGFFDEVCYTGTGSAGVRAIPHNLGVAPELIISKFRNKAGENWLVYAAPLGATKYLELNTTSSAGTYQVWGNTSPTSTNFYVQTDYTNQSGYNFVTYLFASCPGVSKVGSYTGTGTTQTINCGFTTGARFVLIKRTDSTGDWFVWDSARGISSGNDPYLLLNSTAAEVTGTNYVDTDTTGFKVTAAAPAGINANGGSYIFLAVA